MSYLGTVRYSVHNGDVEICRFGKGFYIDPTPDELEKILPIIDVLRVAGFDNVPYVSSVVSPYPNKDAYVYFDIDHDYNIVAEV